MAENSYRLKIQQPTMVSTIEFAQLSYFQIIIIFFLQLNRLSSQKFVLAIVLIACFAKT